MMRDRMTSIQLELKSGCRLPRKPMLLGALVLALAAGAGTDARPQGAMQGVPNAMQGFSQNRDQPIQIEAASLEMVDKKKEATFSGNVKVVQGDTTMKAQSLVVFYDSSSGADKGKSAANKTAMKSAAPGPGGASSIRRLEARGGVVVTQKEQVVTGDLAVFDTRSNLITMKGNVVLTQCKNVLRGDRLFVNMTTGVSRVESDSGRVQGLFIQSEGGGCGAKSTTPAATPPKPPIPLFGSKPK
jgi:lipopolysaccharide export system protein LptA